MCKRIRNTGRDQLRHNEESKNAFLYSFLALNCGKILIKKYPGIHYSQSSSV